MERRRKGGRKHIGTRIYVCIQCIYTCISLVFMYMYLYTCTSPPVRLCSYPDILVALLQLHTHSSLCHDLLCRETPAL